jgi:hypothetical protein
MADLQKREPQIHVKLQRAFRRTGMDAHSARRAISWTLSRRGWTEDARAALLGEMTVGSKAAYVQANYRRLGRAAERLAAGDPVDSKHVGAAVSLPEPSQIPAVLAQAKRDAQAAKAQPSAAEQLAQAMADAFPGMSTDEVIKLVQAAQTKREADAKPPEPTTEGSASSVFLPGPDGSPERHEARYRLVEADDLIPSHNPNGFARRTDYPDGWQERAYHTDKAEQAKVLRNAEKLIPEFVANTNPDAINGAPLVTADGHVLGGNSRTMSMQLAYKEHPEVADRLKGYLEKNASAFGFRPEDVKALKNPVLVREMSAKDKDPRLLVRQMNEAMTQEMDPRTMQVAMGRKLDDRAISALAQDMGPDETLSVFLDSKRGESFINQIRRVGLIDQRNASRYIDKRGKLNADGKTLVERVLVGKLVGDPDLLSDTPPSMVSALARSIPYMIQAEAHGEGYNVRGDLKQALDAHNDMKRRGMDDRKDPGRAVDDYLRMVEMREKGGRMVAGEHPLANNPRGMAMLATLSKKSGPQQLSKVFRNYAEQASHNPEGQSGLFGPSKTPGEVFADAAGEKPKKDEENQQGGLFKSILRRFR